MEFLRKLLGGSGGDESGDRDGMYFYVKTRRTGEVIQVRLHRTNDLSLMDDMKTYYVRKLIMGTKSFDRLEAEFTFDQGRHLLSADITGGELVEKDDYDAYLAAQQEG